MGGIGAFMSSYFLKKYSRIECYQIIGMAMILISLFILTGSQIMLFLGRLVQGLIIGMTSSINPIYIKEISPVQLTGSLCPINQIMIVVGITYSFFQAFLLSLILPAQIYWRIVFGFPILTSAIMLYNLKYNYPYDTPKYLMLMKRNREAKDLLRVIYKEQFAQQVYTQIEDAIKEQKKVQKFQEDIHKQQAIEMQEIGKPESMFKTISLKEQLIPRHSSQTQLTNNTLAVIIVFNLSFHQQFVGMGVILAYSGQLIKILYPSLEKIFPVLVNIIAITCVFLSVPVLRIFGRKDALLYGGISLVLCLFCIARCFGQLDTYDPVSSSVYIKIMIIILILMIRAIFSVTTGPIVWVYAAQIVQPNILSLSVMINWFSVAVVNLTFPVLNQLFGGNPSHVFDIYCLLTLICYMINRYGLVETSNKTQIQIRRQFDKKWQ